MRSRQYRSVIFYHNEEQKGLAEEFKKREEKSLGKKLYTDIEPIKEFYLAEDYHQKYRLQNYSGLTKEFKQIYPEMENFIASTAVTRANGYVAGNGTLEQLERELPQLGLSSKAQEKLLKIFKRRNPEQCGIGL